MPTDNRRIIGFLFIALVMAGAVVGFAAIPQNTLRQNAGIVFPTINATAGYYVGNVQIIDAATAAALATLDTGQGANELYDMDQNVLTTSNVNFTSIEADDFYYNSQNYTAWIETEIDAIPKHDQTLNTTDDVTFHGVATGWVDLGGVNRTTWPAGGGVGYNHTAYTVTCIMDGSNRLAIAHDGEILYNNTSSYTCLQTAANYVTRNAAGNPTWRKGRVNNNTAIRVGFGDWNMGSSRLLLPSRVCLQGLGREATTIRSSHATSPIGPMWSNCTWGTAIYDMRIDAESTGYPIKWDLTDASLPGGETYGWGLLDLQRLHLTDYDTYSFYWNTDSGNHAVLHINDVRAQGLWMIDRMFDSTITMFQCSKLIIKDSSACTIDHFYIGGGHDYNLRIYDGSVQNDNYDLTFTNGILDNPTQTCVSIEHYAENLIFDGITCSNLNWNSANNTFSAFILGGNTHHIKITDSQFVNDLVYDHASTWKYLIEEQNGSHNNIYLGNSYADNSYRGIEVWDRATGRIYKSWDYTVSYWERPYGTSHGTAEASNDDWIKHGLDPSLAVDMGNCTITLTVQESDAPYTCQVKAVNGTKFQIYLYDIAAAGVEETDKTIDWVAMYEP